jgi:hypothetical protein
MIVQKQLVRWILLAALFGGVPMTAFPGAASAQMVVAKRCGKCNHEVPVAAQAGQMALDQMARQERERRRQEQVHLPGANHGHPRTEPR